MLLSVGLTGVHGLCGLHLKPGLLIKITSLSTENCRSLYI